MTHRGRRPVEYRLRRRVSLDDQRWPEGVGPARAGRASPRPEAGASAARGATQRAALIITTAQFGNTRQWD